ncbi:hypothetical protein O3M35_011264 [Rhynocoris fuscipes]|uniref:Protein MMS22-like n=1 Tax=Rhynocoris fuscipes TaxID=488301 RepID=A0AAW1D1Q0_9HEMI
MDLTRLLNDKNSSIEIIASSWWSFYRINAADAFEILTELMFQIGGWIEYKYKINGFPTIETFKNIKDYGPLSLIPLIMESEEDFQSKFRHFISLIAEYDRCRILYDKYFFTHIGKMFELLTYGRWDSFRLVAFITGRQLWNSLEKEFSERRYFPSQHWQILLKEHSWPYFRIHDELKPCYDFLSWSISSPSVLIDDMWHHTILCWLREKSSETKAVAHMAVYHLFRKKLDIQKQKKLMKYLKPDFIYSLNVKSLYAEISMRTLLMAVRYMDIEMNQAEIECMIAQLYEPIETSIALLAGKLFCTSNITPFAFDAPANIVRLLEVNIEANASKYLPSSDLLIDSVYMHVYKQITWLDWIQVVADSPRDNVAHALSLLCSYLCKATTNFAPSVRVKQVIEAMTTKKDHIENRKKFTQVFSSGWLEIASYNKVRISAPQKLAKLAQYFDNSLETNAMREIAYILCGLHCCTSDPTVSDECCKSLQHLANLILINDHFNERGNIEAVNVIVQSLVKVAQKDFTTILSSYPASMSQSELVLPHNTLIMKKMLSVCQWLIFDDSHLWHSAMGKLTVMSVLPLTQNLVQTLLILLFQMVMKSADRVLALQKELAYDSSKKKNLLDLNNITNLFVSRALLFKLEARHFLNRRYSPSLRSATYYALLDLLEFSLINFQYRNHVLAQLTSFDGEEIEALVSYALEFMEFTQCNKHFLPDTNVRCCCFVISRICDLISRGFLDIHLCFTPFIKLIGKNAVHDEIIIKCLNDYSWMFPHKWENIAITIFNALISLLDDSLVKYISPENSTEEYENALLWTPVQNLAEILSGGRLKEPIVRTAWLKLHTHVINCALGPGGFPSLLRVLYTFKDLLVLEDLCFIANYLLQYYYCDGKTKNLEEIEAYVRHLNKAPSNK